MTAPIELIERTFDVGTTEFALGPIGGSSSGYALIFDAGWLRAFKGRVCELTVWISLDGYNYEPYMTEEINGADLQVPVLHRTHTWPSIGDSQGRSVKLQPIALKLMVDAKQRFKLPHLLLQVW